MALETPQPFTPENPLPPDVANMSVAERNALMQQLESLKAHVEQPEISSTVPDAVAIHDDAKPNFGEEEPVAIQSSEVASLSEDAKRSNLGALVSGIPGEASALLAKVENLESTPADFRGAVEQGKAGDIIEQLYNSGK